MKNKNVRHKVLGTAISLVLLSSSPISYVQAADKYWSYPICGNGWWDTNCWSATFVGVLDGNGQPVDGDNVFLYNASTTSYVVQYENTAYPFARLGSLKINSTNTGDMLFSQGQDTLSVYYETVGDTGTGAVSQYGGTHNVLNTLTLGNTATGSGSFSMSGPSASMSVGDTMFVGLSGDGSLSIQNGADVSTLSAFVGMLSGSSGDVTLSDAGSTWTNTNSVSVGGYGTTSGGAGQLTVQNNAVMDVGDTLRVLSTGNLTLDGGNITTANLTAATGTFDFLDGTLTIDSGVYDDGNTDMSVGGLGVGKDSILALDNGASASPAGHVYIGGGSGGTGALTVLNGSTLTSTTGNIGRNSGNIGAVTVDGTGSSWTTTSGIAVGLSGSGALTIQNGGVVSGGTGTVGYNATSDGTAIIDGVGSAWNGSALIVGRDGTGNLTIQNDGSVTNDFGFIGQRTGGVGTVTVDGTGSNWTSNTGLYVGGTTTAAAGDGTFNVQNGGSVDVAGTLKIWNTGILNLSGGNITTDNLDAAFGTFNFSDGTMTVDGGIYDDGATNLAIDSTVVSTNPTLVLDNGASATPVGNTTIGVAGTGSLVIQNGSTVSNNIGHVGLTSSSTGSVVVDGTGSNWTNSSNLYVGSSGTGELTIQNGGAVSVIQDVFIGKESGSEGLITVDGAASTMGGTGSGAVDFIVGDLGNGELVVSNGGNVSTQGRVFKMGASHSGTGSVTVDGVDSSVDAGLSYIGLYGDTDLNILNGGSVISSDSYVAYPGHSTSVVTIDVEGAGSSWSSNNIYLGGGTTLGGSATLNVKNEGSVNVAGLLKVWDTSTVNLNGGNINTGTLSLDGTFNFNAGTLNIAADYSLDTTEDFGGDLSLNGFKSLNVGGTTTLLGYNTLSLDGGTFSTGSLINNGGFAFNSGTFNLTGDDLVIGAGGLFGNVVQFGITQTVNVTNTTTIESGSVLSLANGNLSSGVIVNQGTVSLDGPISTLGGGTLINDGMLTGNGRVSARLENVVAGEVRTMTGGAMTFNGTGNNNYGRFNMLGGIMEFTDDLTNNSTGEITGHGALITGTGLTNQGAMAFTDTTDVLGDVNNDTGGSILVSGNTTTFYDDVVHNGTEIRVTNSSQAVFFGTVSGAGSYTGTGEVIFAGDVLPGNSPAMLTMEGDLVLANTASTMIELGGLLAGDEYDAFDIGGSLTLGGELDVVMYDLGSGLFEAGLGDSFDIFAAETIIGGFDLLTFALLGEGLDWELNYLTDEIGTLDIARLSVVSASTVPVPPAVWLFGSGLLGLVAIARRRKVT